MSLALLASSRATQHLLRAALVASALLTACGGATTPPDAADAADASPPGDTPPPDAPGPACTLELDAQSPAQPIELSQGGRVQLALSASTDVTAVEVTSTPEGAFGYLDAAARRYVLRAPYGAQGPVTATLRGTCANGGTAERAVMLTVRAIRWRQLPAWQAGTTGPLAREYGSMWVDGGDPDRVLLFGGFHYVPAQFTPANDWWAYDLRTNAWAALAPAMAPPLAPGGRFSQVPGTRGGLFYGGLRMNGTRTETLDGLYRVDTTPGSERFEAVTATMPRPPGDYQPGMVFDAARNRHVAYCGASATLGYHCNVWLYDATAGTWGMVPFRDDVEWPEGRAGFFTAHDVEAGRVVIFSGEMGGAAGGGACNCAEGTWALELAETPPRWVRLVASTPDPPARRNGASALDTDGNRMLVWGGTADGRMGMPGVWLLTLDRGHERWDRVDPPDAPANRASSMAVYDAPRRRFVIGFGNGAATYADLWALEL